MYRGHWNVNVLYRRGDIVFSSITKSYYACTIGHMSCQLVFPSDTDIYWVYIDGTFLNNYSVHTSNNTCDDYFTQKRKSSSTQPQTSEDTEYKLKISHTDTTVPDTTAPDTKSPDTTAPFTAPVTAPDTTTRTLPNGLESLSESPFAVVSEETIKERTKRLATKRKLKSIERSLDDYKRNKYDEVTESTREKIMLLDIDIETKSYILDKYENSKYLSGSEYSKAVNWVNTILSLPFGKFKDFGNVRSSDSPSKLQIFFKQIRDTLDENVHGLDDVKQEILEFVARKISNPSGKGHVLALCGSAGVGKTKILKSLADALKLPFLQINCGGLNDASVLIGHSETYVGSKPGKLVEMLSKSECMNPIVYLDEIDKVSDSKSREINGILTHLLDEEQNDKFQDNYLSNVPINLSKALFVISFNDISKVDSIVLDRMKLICINSPSIEDKLTICQTKIIPELLKTVKIKRGYVIQIDKEVIETIVTRYSQNEQGVRQLKKNFEKLMNRINYDVLVNDFSNLKVEKRGSTSNLIVTSTYVNSVLGERQSDSKQNFLSMYS